MNTRYLTIFTLCLLLYTGRVSAQDNLNIDSLLKLLPAAKEDTGKVALYITIGNQYEASEPEKAKQYYLAARDLSTKLNYTPGTIKFISNYAYVLNTQGKLDSSLILNLQSVELAKQLNDKNKLAATYGNTGSSYQYLEKYDEAVKYYILSEKYAEESGNKTYTQTLNNNLGLVYKNLGQYDKAIAHFNKAISMARELNATGALSRALNNYSTALLSINKTSEAIQALQEAIRLAKANGDDYAYHSLLLNMGDAQIRAGHYSEIKQYAVEALALAKQLDDKESIAISLRAMGYYYFYQKAYDSSWIYAQQSLQQSRAINNKESEHTALALLSDICLTREQFSQFAYYRNLADSVENAVQLGKVSEKIEEYNVKYETEKKEIQIALQQAQINQKNTLNYVLIGSAAFLLVLSVLIYLNYTQKQKLQRQRIAELETEKKLMATEAVLKGEEQERTRLAKDLHDGLGGMLSGLKYSFSTMKGHIVMTTENQEAFDRGMNMLDNSIKEMRRVAHNMMPEALVKFGLDTALKDFCNDINQSKALSVSYQSIGLADTAMPQTTAITVYRIVQELINNTLKHADARTGIVQVVKTDNQLAVTVEDDGKGFNTAVLNEAKGIGWTNIQSRVDFLKGNMDVQSTPNEGTSVHIEFDL